MKRILYPIVLFILIGAGMVFSQIRPAHNASTPAAALSFGDHVPKGSPAPLTLFYTGDVTGHIEPCG